MKQFATFLVQSLQPFVSRLILIALVLNAGIELGNVDEQFGIFVQQLVKFVQRVEFLRLGGIEQLGQQSKGGVRQWPGQEEANKQGRQTGGAGALVQGQSRAQEGGLLVRVRRRQSWQVEGRQTESSATQAQGSRHRFTRNQSAKVEQQSSARQKLHRQQDAQQIQQIFW